MTNEIEMVSNVSGNTDIATIFHTLITFRYRGYIFVALIPFNDVEKRPTPILHPLKQLPIKGRRKEIKEEKE